MTENIDKNTHEITLWQPLFKSKEGGKYIAVLSDTSTDRDGEIVGEGALQKIMDHDGPDGYLVGLMDHENKILNQVCEWTNKRLEKRDGHTALVAEPRFFESNNNARQIKGMLDEGARMGISIGAIVKNKKEEKILGKTTTVYTEVELLEASFVAIPSNRHGQVMAVAKSFNNKIKKEADTMSDEKTFTQKEYDDIVSKKEDLEKKYTDLEKKNKETVDELAKLKKENEDSAKPEDNASDGDDSASDAKAEETEKKLKAAEEELAKIKKSPHYKGMHDDNADGTKKFTDEELDKHIKSGELPIIRRSK